MKSQYFSVRGNDYPSSSLLDSLYFNKLFRDISSSSSSSFINLVQNKTLTVQDYSFLLENTYAETPALQALSLNLKLNLDRLACKSDLREPPATSLIETPKTLVNKL